MNQIQNLPYLLSLHLIDGLGPIRLKRIMDYFKDPKLAWEAPLKEINSLGIPQNVLQILIEKRKSLDPLEYFEYIKKCNIKVLTVFDENYPVNLKQIYDPPLIIFYKGEISTKDNNAIAVVGTRKITGYGKIVTEKFTRGLVEAGFTIVSGLARGVDTIAHQTAIETNGRTLAILGGGLNQIFPPENKNLARKIEEGFGAIISEYPPDYPSLSGNFPSRNRIISGLSKATLVTEAAEDSGSLITARLSIEDGKEVFAVPGPITSNVSNGTAKLIKDGAKLTSSIEDILEELGIDKIQSPEAIIQNLTNLTASEKQVLECLENEQKHIDELCRETKLQSAEISGLLIKMEIIGLVKNLGGGIYISLANEIPKMQQLV